MMQTSEIKVRVCIFVGGQGKRLGRGEKAALEVDGESILSRQLRVADEAGFEVTLIGPSDFATTFDCVRLIDDRSRGPIGGFELATRYERFIAIACDMPFVDAMLLRHLAESLDDNIDAAMPKSGEFWQPFAGIYRGQAVRNAMEKMSKNSVHGMLSNLNIREVVIESKMTADIDTPADAKRWLT